MKKSRLIDKFKESTRWQEFSISAVATLLLMLVISILFDYYYCMNDDTTMRDILCGSYTGTPESRNIQMLYPVSAFISMFYRIFPNAPWYGIFLCGCQYLCVFLICNRTIKTVNAIWAKAVISLMTILFAGGILLYELVFVQYTMTCGIMMAAATFRFYTSDAGKDVKSFLSDNLVSVILVVLAFQIRTEMAILMFPFLLAAGLCKWSKEEKFFTKQNFGKYIGLIGSVLVLMGVSILINRAAYGVEEWKKFNLFFDYRTEIYDFLGAPTYEKNQDFYDEVGLSKAEAALLHNYNFALDEKIDENVLGQMVEYQKTQRGGNALFLVGMGDALWIYKNSLLSDDYMPYNGLILFLYVLLAAVAWKNKDKSYLWKLPMFGGVRTICWMYIILRNRMPERITHGLFFMELMVLFALLATEWGRKKMSRLTVSAIACIIVALSLPAVWSRAYTSSIKREEINKEWIYLQEYCKENEENYYLIDVYSSVDYTEKMFENVDNSYRNFDLCGGWTAKSPLYEEKLAQRGITDIENDLKEKENLFFVIKANRDIEWLTEYYKEKGIKVQTEIFKEIELNGEVRFVIYRLL
ncbi:MAG: hypothetical protein IJN54_12825 [Lachnospiraceae bacterium]|nr:hypothetical protein [Lachnospiraceae bacterium]